MVTLDHDTRYMLARYHFLLRVHDQSDYYYGNTKNYEG